MQDYITLGGYKFSTNDDETWLDDNPSTPTYDEYTLDGTHMQSDGVTKGHWEYNLLVKDSGEAAGYGTYAQLRSIFNTGGDVAFVAQKDATSYTVHILNRSMGFRVKKLSQVPYQSGSWYLVHVELGEV